MIRGDAERLTLTREGTVTPIPQQAENEPTATFNPAQIKEFTPQQNYDLSTNVRSNSSSLLHLHIN